MENKKNPTTKSFFKSLNKKLLSIINYRKNYVINFYTNSPFGICYTLYNDILKEFILNGIKITSNKTEGRVYFISRRSFKPPVINVFTGSDFYNTDSMLYRYIPPSSITQYRELFDIKDNNELITFFFPIKNVIIDLTALCRESFMMKLDLKNKELINDKHFILNNLYEKCCIKFNSDNDIEIYYINDYEKYKNYIKKIIFEKIISYKEQSSKIIEV